MATKKQKREAALAKREKFMQEERENGLRAQALDRAKQEQHRETIRKNAEALNARYKAILASHGIHD